MHSTWLLPYSCSGSWGTRPSHKPCSRLALGLQFHRESQSCPFGQQVSYPAFWMPLLQIQGSCVASPSPIMFQFQQEGRAPLFRDGGYFNRQPKEAQSNALSFSFISLRLGWLNSRSCDCSTLGSVFLEKMYGFCSLWGQALPLMRKEGFAPLFLCAQGPPTGASL